MQLNDNSCTEQQVKTYQPEWLVVEFTITVNQCCAEWVEVQFVLVWRFWHLIYRLSHSYCQTHSLIYAWVFLDIKPNVVCLRGFKFSFCLRVEASYMTSLESIRLPSSFYQINQCAMLRECGTFDMVLLTGIFVLMALTIITLSTKSIRNTPEYSLFPSACSIWLSHPESLHISRVKF